MQIRKHRCTVCGRIFPDGQGIVIEANEGEIAFHSSKCAARFLRMLLDRGHKEVLSASLRLARELEELLKEKQEKTSKRI